MSRISIFARSAWELARRLRRDRAGQVAVIAGLGALTLCGVVGLAIDVGLWYHTTRAMQNAADAAAIAAARDGGAGTYQQTGLSVAAGYGFNNGNDGVTVTINNGQTCPGGSPSNCYIAGISQTAPHYFSSVLGILPNTLNATAVVSPFAGPQTHQYCLLALAGSGITPALRTNGSPNANMTGCSVMSNTGADCNGHNLLATYGDAHDVNGGSAGCGINQDSHVPAVSDPYSSLASNIPADPCSGTYNSEPAKKKDPPLPASNQWSGSLTLPANTAVCGDLQLTANTTITSASPGSVITIYNGQLDSNGYTLATAAGSGTTVVFSGNAGISTTQYPTGGGTFNIIAPTSGTWSGVAVYQNPTVPAQSITYAGNSPTWDITGLVYLPNASVTMSGAVNKGATGSCFVLVIDNITINGTADIEATGGCDAAGLSMPSDSIPNQLPALVQ